MALSVFQFCVVFTLGLLLGSASVWAGGGEGPGPPQRRGGGARAVLKGAPLRLPCTAPDPRSAARSKPKHSNMLEIGSSHKASTDEYEEEPDSPLNVLKEEDFYYGTKENEFNQSAEDVEHPSDFELSDDDSILGDDVPRRRGNDKYKKKQRGKEMNNRKLERKQLDGGRKRKLRLKPEIRDDEDYEDGTYRGDKSLITYTWSHNGTEIKANERRYILPNGTLFFKKFGNRRYQKEGLQDTGEYRCVINGSTGSTISPILNLSYAFMNRDFSRYPVDTEVYEGDSVQVSCNISSDPPAKITWMKESKVLTPDKRIYHLSPNSLLITNVNIDDIGKYRCVARNIVANKTRFSPEGIITVMKQQQLHYPISFVYDEFENFNDTLMQHVKNVTAYYGDDVYLSCAVNGRPKPKVVWSYQADGSSVQVREISSMEIHRIPKITEDMSGVYTCVANNPHQSIKQVYHVEVLRAPYIRQGPIPEHTPTAKLVRFNCSAGGSPAPNLMWYRDGQPLNITGRVKLKSLENKSPELIISDTVSDDKGIYQCIAWNSVGETSAWAPLSVQTQNVPPPHNVKCKPVEADAVRISWSPPKGPVMAYTVHFVLADGGEERTMILTDEGHDLKKLELYRKYDIYVKAYNTHGASDQSEHAICHGQGVKIYLSYMDGNNSIHIAWKEQPTIVKSWMVQWRLFDKSSNFVHNITLPGNASSFIVPDAFPLEKFEYRVLASPSEKWIDQNLELIPWTSAKNRSMTPYKEINQSHLDEFDASSPRIQDPEIIDWTGLDYPRPTSVVATPLGPHSINISWTCDAAESSSDAYSFDVCYAPTNHIHNEMRMITLEKRNETCQSSFNTWTVVRGLEPATYYAIKVQAIMQNKAIGGPYSEIAICRTKRDEKSSVSDVRWKKVADKVIKVSWTHIINSNLLEDDDSIIELSEDGTNSENNNINHNSAKRSWTYTIRYSQDMSSPIESWPSKNVTDETSLELTNLDPERDCFLMVFVAGENKGSPLDITAKDMQTAPVAVDVKHIDPQLGILLGLLLLFVCFLVLCGVVLWHRRKIRREQQGQLSVQMRSRAGKSDFECQELMNQPPYVDSKGGVICINGVDSDGTMSSEVGEPLLNGHIRITENPRFLGKKHMGNGNCRPLLSKKSLGPVFDGTFDVSRYEELPDITIETVLEADISDQIGSSATSNSTLPMGHKQCVIDERDIDNMDCNGSATDNITVEVGCNYAVDRNSNSDVTNVKNHTESLCNEITISDKLNKNSGAKSLSDNDKQDVVNERISSDKGTMNCIAEKMKNKTCGVDALSSYRENGGARRIAPVIGPNG